MSRLIRIKAMLWPLGWLSSSPWRSLYTVGHG